MSPSARTAKIHSLQHKPNKRLKYSREQAVRINYSRLSDRRQRHPPLSFSSSSGQACSASTESLTPDKFENSDDPAPSVKTWPPYGHAEINQDLATTLIYNGAATFLGTKTQAGHAPHGCFAYHVFTSPKIYDDEVRSSATLPSFLCVASLSLSREESAQDLFPYNTLEQPSLRFSWGVEPGTTTLYRWIASSRSLPPTPPSLPQVARRELSLMSLLARLNYVQHGIDPDPVARQEYLYQYLIYDSNLDKLSSDRLHGEIAVIINVLDTEHWFDFSKIENQIVANFYVTQDFTVALKFFQQLLLSVELFQRIHSVDLSEDDREDFLSKISLRVAYDIALAQRWLENMSLEETWDQDSAGFHFVLRQKFQQIKLLEQFANELNWPCAGEIGHVLEDQDLNHDGLENRSLELMSWCSGVILPGATTSWLVMKCLLDCDRDIKTSFDGLCQMYPNTGLQYRSSTYWYWECIVGKVMGAATGVKQVAGWIGPCAASPDLDQVQCIRVQQHPLKYQMAASKVKSMARRSNPLGPQSRFYSVDDYQLVIPDTDDIVDSIRIEKLSFLPSRTTASALDECRTYNAAVVFAIDGESWPIRLRYDVSFVASIPCSSGPHVLFYKFLYHCIRIDKLLYQRRWGKAAADEGASYFSSSSSSKGSSFGSFHEQTTLEEPESVLVVEAFGVPDNETLARSWCAHIGLSAVVANIRDTCMACSIRQAYAALISVVILTDWSKDDDDDIGDTYPSCRDRQRL